MDESEIFTEYCGGFLKSAEEIETMFAFSAIAVTAWNHADKPQDEIKKIESVLQKRLKTEKIENHGRVYRVDDLIRQMMVRKRNEYGDCTFKVASANFEDDPGELKIKVRLLES